MTRRFCNPKVTQFGRIGHPGAIERRLVRCAGVTFEDRQLGRKWTYRKYDAYNNLWPAMDVWTVQTLSPVSRQEGVRGQAYGNQSRVEEQYVPEEVKAFAVAELVRLRLRGKVRA